MEYEFSDSEAAVNFFHDKFADPDYDPYYDEDEY
jgi:hypothetical protein